MEILRNFQLLFLFSCVYVITQGLSSSADTQHILPSQESYPPNEDFSGFDKRADDNLEEQLYDYIEDDSNYILKTTRDSNKNEDQEQEIVPKLALDPQLGMKMNGLKTHGFIKKTLPFIIINLPSGMKQLIVPVKVKKHKIPQYLPIRNLHTGILGSVYQESGFPKESSSQEVLEQIFRMSEEGKNTNEENFKNALFTDSKVYNISKIPNDNTPEKYYVQKKENISVKFQQSVTNYTDTHIKTLETILDPDDIKDSLKQDKDTINKYDDTSSDSKQSNPDAFVAGTYIKPYPPNDGPSPEIEHEKGPYEFVGGTYVEEDRTDVIPSSTNVEDTELIDGGEKNLEDDLAQSDSLRNEQKTEFPVSAGQSENVNNTDRTENPLGREFTSGHLVTDNVDDLSTSVKPEYTDMTNFPTDIPAQENTNFINTDTPTTQSQLKESNDIRNLEEKEYFTSSEEQDSVPEGSVTNGELAKVTDESITTTEKYIVNDGLQAENSDTHPSVISLSEEDTSTNLPSSNMVGAINENNLDYSEEDSTDRGQDVELFAGTGPEINDSEINKARGTQKPQTTTEETTLDKDKETLVENSSVEICFPLINGKKVSIFDLLSGKLYLENGGKTIPLTLGDSPLSDCHSGTNKCRLHLNVKDNPKKTIDLASEGKQENKIVRKRALTDILNDNQSLPMIIQILNGTGNNKIKHPYKESELYQPAKSAHNKQIDGTHKMIRSIRSLHLKSAETTEKSSCGCGDILAKALPPIPPYEHFLGKRLDILTNIAHAAKDWFVTTR